MTNKKLIIPRHLAHEIAKKTFGFAGTKEEETQVLMELFARDYIRILSLRHSNLKTIAALAEIDASNYGKWLRGQNTLSAENVSHILKILSVTPEELNMERTAREIINLLKADFNLSTDDEVLPFFKERFS